MPVNNKNKAKDQIRLNYWNENYVQYWKSRVTEANASKSEGSSMVAGDVATAGDVRYKQAIDLLGVNPRHRLLELGCGFGRSLPVLSLLACEVDAVDISKQMIETAEREYSDININFHVSPSEDMPFRDEKFDRIVCFAAFDAMFQKEALIEMHRVTKLGGRILLTGKSDNYYPDDRKAYEAELGARAKGHPNYFTDVPKLLADLGHFGFGKVHAIYYERRGDFADGHGSTVLPLQFYEYLLVLEKKGPCKPNSEVEYCRDISRTFLLQHEIVSVSK